MAQFKISVIGCGWLGLPLAIHLLNKGHHVSGSTRHVSRFEALEMHGIHPFKFDFDHPDAESMPKADITIITVPPSSSSNYLHALSVITQNMDPDSHLIFCSTTSVYQDLDGVVCTESAIVPGDITTVDTLDTARHGTPRRVLIEAEGIISTHLHHTILRLAGLFGPGRHPVTYLSGKSNLSKPHAPVNLIHQSDIIRLMDVLVGTGDRPPVINVSAGQHPTRLEYYTEVALSLGLPVPQFNMSDTMGGKIIDNQRLVAILGCDPVLRDPSID